jgi:hypothetical protein
MLRIGFKILLVILALVTPTCAGDIMSPLYSARLAATLAEWDAGLAAPVTDSGDPEWWPASLNPASLCVGSACPQSYCFGSICGESFCLGSGCIGSSCIGSGCVASVCGVSGCAGTTLCLKKCGYTGGPPNAIDPTQNGTTFVNGSCMER